tara:strand:- start:1101 stop:1367 length:267 start_codon:yes stop_codon:yes gene_type:complete
MSFDQNPANTDWQALGLPDQSPFDILSRPRAVPNAAAKPPRKRGPKPSVAQRVIASLRDLPKPARFCTDIMSKAESDRTNAIAGRGFA